MQKPKKKKSTKKTVRKLKKGKGVDPQAAAIMKKIAGKTSDPVKSGSAGSGKITKTTSRQKVTGAGQSNLSTRMKKKLQSTKKAIKKGVDTFMGYKDGGKMKYNDGGRVQHD